MKLPFKVDLSDKVVAVTGGGGVLMSAFGEALVNSGAKVAFLDINEEAVKKVVEGLGENAMAVKCNCLDKTDIARAKAEVNAKFGKVNFLINGAGGNNPKATCDNETMTPDLTGVKDFFALDESGLKFVFDPANYVQVGEDVAAALDKSGADAAYFHIKDAIKTTGEIVPAGEGNGEIEKLITLATGDKVFTIEPHLSLFKAYAAIDDTELKNKYHFNTNDEAFDFAVNALKSLLKKQGYEETTEGFIKR